MSPSRMFETEGVFRGDDQARDAVDWLSPIAALARKALGAWGALLVVFSEDRADIRATSGFSPRHNVLSARLFLEDSYARARMPDALASLAGLEAPIGIYVTVAISSSDGERIGAICVFDQIDAAWDERDVRLVTELARGVARQLATENEHAMREKTASDLLTAEARFLAVAENIPGLVFERRKVDDTHSSYRFFGGLKTTFPAANDIVGLGDHSDLGFVLEEDRERVRAALLDSNCNETDVDLTFRVWDKDGSVKWLKSQSIVRHGADPVTWDGLCFDITDLVAAREETERARAEKEVGLININHELRTPLQAIIGFSDFLKTERRPELVEAHVSNINSAASALLSVINTTLEQAECEAEAASCSERVDVRAFAERCMSLVGPTAVAKGLHSRLVVADRVPASIVLDSVKVQQVLLNLLNNAAKFTDAGGFTLSIDRGERGLSFTVADTGIGIPADKRDHIFERFARVEGEAQTRQGSGLGLAITKSLIEELGGSIQVEPSIPHGTIFHVELPVAASTIAVGAIQTSAAPCLLNVSGSRIPPARILVADDLDLNRKLIADMLSLDDHIVDCVADGAAAVKAASEGSYDLILMDMIMPGTDGIAATQAIRTLPKPACDVPIVALTANSFREQLEKCLEAGMDATLTKPMSLETLAATVSMWTQRRKAA